MLGAPIIIVFTKSGSSARIVSAHRPAVPILALTDVPRTYSQLAMVWGVIPQLVPTARPTKPWVARARDVVLSRGLAKEGDRVLVTAGVPFDVPGTTTCSASSACEAHVPSAPGTSFGVPQNRVQLRAVGPPTA
jgi:pyruvate kinase